MLHRKYTVNFFLLLIPSEIENLLILNISPRPPRITLESGRWIVDTDEVELNADQDEFDLEVEAGMF